MDSLSYIAVLLTVAAGAITAILAATSLWRHARRSSDHQEILDAKTEVAGRVYDPRVLADPRSCLQAGLEVFEDTLPPAHTRTDAQRKAGQLVHLLQSSPSLVFAEVVDDRRLLEFERVTAAQTVWIVSTDESIEFEYPGAAVPFSEAVLDNLRRNVNYRYFVMDTAVTRERARKLVELVRGKDLDDRLQIRFLPDRYWTKLRSNADELILFEAGETAEMFYRFPTVKAGVTRNWVKALDDDSQARLFDLHATWGMAEDPVTVPAGEPEFGGSD